mmetsp:Transcript_102752/g.299726  ORF Transcript_102752/g.299726 Transcript_102752/m.299726 type:complete len:129 (+) Transcript_102752:508-894(+)
MASQSQGGSVGRQRVVTWPGPWPACSADQRSTVASSSQAPGIGGTHQRCRGPTTNLPTAEDEDGACRFFALRMKTPDAVVRPGPCGRAMRSSAADLELWLGLRQQSSARAPVGIGSIVPSDDRRRQAC